MSKEIKITLPSKEDIKPVATDTKNAVVEAGQAVPSLALTMAVGGADLAIHSVKEAGKGLKSIGSKLGNAYKARKLKMATETVQKHYDTQMAEDYERRNDTPM